MKVFLLINDPYSFPNPYVSTLIDGLKANFDDVEFGYGIDLLWEDAIFQYDIVHIHWPDIIVDFNPTKGAFESFKSRLLELKKKNVKIIATCHNLQPHYCNNTLREDCYFFVYSIADVMLHLGKYSMNIMREKYPNSRHILFYHHTYDTLYLRKSREESMEFLHLNPNKQYILCFGEFRDNEERKLVDSVAKHFYKNDVLVLAPRYYELVKRRNIFMMLYRWLKIKCKEIVRPGLCIYGRFISDEMLPFFFGASDVSLIQRKKILNSGNLPLGFYMGNVVVGPNVGNVGEILNDTQNPTFQPDNIESLYNALEQALKYVKMGKGEENVKVAQKLFASSIICEKLYVVYKDACLL